MTTAAAHSRLVHFLAFFGDDVLQRMHGDLNDPSDVTILYNPRTATTE